MAKRDVLSLLRAVLVIRLDEAKGKIGRVTGDVDDPRWQLSLASF